MKGCADGGSSFMQVHRPYIKHSDLGCRTVFCHGAVVCPNQFQEPDNRNVTSKIADLSVLRIGLLADRP